MTRHSYFAILGCPMKRPRKDDTEPTPTSNRDRILAIEQQLARVEEMLNLHQRALDIQLQRIGEIQADLDAIRAAWTDRKPVRKGKLGAARGRRRHHAAPRSPPVSSRPTSARRRR